MPRNAATPTTPAPAATSTPAARARSARPNRRPHPNLAALKERAFALTCTGLRSPAIALQLGVPERTIRRWINDTLLSLAQDALDPDPDCDPDSSNASNKSNNCDDATTSTRPNESGVAATTEGNSSPVAGDTTSADTRAAPIPLERQRALAIESQRAVAATAHAAYDRLMARHDDLLDTLTTVLRDNLLTTTGVAAAAATPAPLPPSAALLTRLLAQLEAGASHHLRIAQAAHRDAARFQGVAAYAQADARLTATEAHADAEPAEDAEPEGGLVPIEWVDPNDPTKEGLIPRHTFDAKAAIDAICNAPTSSLSRLQQVNGAETTDVEDDDEDEQSEESILAAIMAEQIASDSLAATPSTPASSVTTPATGAATSPATAPATDSHFSSPDPSPRRRTLRREAPSGAVSTARSAPATASVTAPATVPATSAATTPATNPASVTLPSEGAEQPQSAARGQGVRSAPREEEVPPVLTLSSTRPPPTLPRSNTIAALFLRNPHYVF